MVCAGGVTRAVVIFRSFFCFSSFQFGSCFCSSFRMWLALELALSWVSFVMRSYLCDIIASFFFLYLISVLVHGVSLYVFLNCIRSSLCRFLLDLSNFLLLNSISSWGSFCRLNSCGGWWASMSVSTTGMSVLFGPGLDASPNLMPLLGLVLLSSVQPSIAHDGES